MRRPVATSRSLMWSTLTTQLSRTRTNLLKTSDDLWFVDCGEESDSSWKRSASLSGVRLPIVLCFLVTLSTPLAGVDEVVGSASGPLSPQMLVCAVNDAATSKSVPHFLQLILDVNDRGHWPFRRCLISLQWYANSLPQSVHLRVLAALSTKKSPQQSHWIGAEIIRSAWLYDSSAIMDMQRPLKVAVGLLRARRTPGWLVHALAYIATPISNMTSKRSISETFTPPVRGPYCDVHLLRALWAAASTSGALLNMARQRKRHKFLRPTQWVYHTEKNYTKNVANSLTA